jgi:type IV secretion system protein VirB10
MKKESIESPDYLETPVHVQGVRRLNRIPIFIAVVMAVFFVSVMTYGYVNRVKEIKNDSIKKEEKISAAAIPAVTKPAGPDVVLPTAPPPEMFSTPVSSPMPTEAGLVHQHQIPEHVKKQIAAHDAALHADTAIAGFSRNTLAQKPSNAPVQNKTAPTETGQNSDDLNHQDEKKEFLKSFDPSSIYLKHTRLPAASPLQIHAGHIIPGIMITGVNSDLPGQIVGQVRQNVYDSATGRNLLIPAGAKLVGTYDSSISAGQERVLVAWNRVMFPDGSSLSLDAMPGADQSGYAGFHDQVDNHYWRTFGNAALLSLFSAGIQLSQPRAAVQGTYNSQQIMAAAIGQQLGRLGMQLTQRNLNIQPTLEIRPGFRFSVMVTKDMILPPWN